LAGPSARASSSARIALPDRYPFPGRSQRTNGRSFHLIHSYHRRRRRRHRYAELSAQAAITLVTPGVTRAGDFGRGLCVSYPTLGPRFFEVPLLSRFKVILATSLRHTCLTHNGEAQHTHPCPDILHRLYNLTSCCAGSARPHRRHTAFISTSGFVLAVSRRPRPISTCQSSIAGLRLPS
jgi:hypothetical protein